MIAPKDTWAMFTNDAEKLQYMIEHKLVAPGSTYSKILVYSGAFVQDPTPCTLEGTSGKNTAVIRIGEELHCIDPDYLAEMQGGFASSSAPENYVVLDLETTGLSCKTDRIIEIAAVKYRYGIEQDFFDYLINPEMTIPMNSTKITGIFDDDVQDAPVLAEVMPELMSFLGDLPIVAHNAPFDRSFLQEAARSADMSFNNKWIDTLSLAKKAFPSAGSYKLEDLKSFLHIPIEQSHRALPDVRATASLFEACNEALRNAQAAKVSRSYDLRNNMDPLVEDESAILPKPRLSSKSSCIQPTVETIDTSGEFYGKNVVFTGELSISRKDAMQLAVNAGAIIKSSVTQKTDYIVVGTQDITLVGDDGMSAKEETAHALNEAGKATIRFLNEAEFYETLKKKRESNNLSSNETVEMPDDIRFQELTAAPLGEFYIDELAAAKIIARPLKEALLADGLGTNHFLLLYKPSQYIDSDGSIKKSQFSSLCFQNKNNLFCRICFRGRSRYVEIPSKYEEEASKYCDVNKPKKKDGSDRASGYIKLPCKTPSDLELLEPLFCHMLQDTLDNYPTEFGCCSKYEECSNAKKCVNINKDLALQCYYLKNLRHGHIFYGSNKTDDGEFFS